jgi:hypothetical protein
MTGTTWTKPYQDPRACREAAAHHRWLAQQVHALDAPLLIPRAQRVQGCELVLDYVPGQHARPGDLVMIAGLMGRLHHAAHHDALHAARLDMPFPASRDLTIPDFIAPRRYRIRARLQGGHVPEPAFSADQAVEIIEAAAGSPAAIYTDANLRNLLVTGSRVTMVDYDCLTLAPFGYDLAKLIVSLAMTHGTLPPTTIGDALTAYNTAVTAPPRPLPAVLWHDLMHWTEIHHILTSPYQGRHGYRHSWHKTRPTPTPEPGPSQAGWSAQG